MGRRCTSTSNIERSIVSGFSPWLMVRLPCGSRSQSRTCSPCSANATPRFSVVVVLATPPFWLANAMTRAEPGVDAGCGRVLGRGTRRARLIGVPLSGHGSNVLRRSRRTFRALLAFPVVELGDTRHQADAAKVDLLRARVPRDVVRLAGAVREHA